MIELLPDIFHILLSLAVVLVAYTLYKRTGNTGLAFLGFGFLVLTVPYFINLALGGPNFAANMSDAGYPTAYIGMIAFYRFIFTAALELAFAILVILGLLKIAHKG